MYRHLSLLFLACSCSLLLHAQGSKRFFFTHYGTSLGLISSEVNAVVQDNNGYMWVGTNDGLQRYDGTRFKTFRHDRKNPGSIPSNLVWQLLMDAKNNLWLLTADGHVGIFDTKDFTFHEASVQQTDEISLRSSIKRLIKDEYGNVFLMFMGSELLAYDLQKNEFASSHLPFHLPEGIKVASMAQEPGSHRYWIGIQGKGVLVADVTSGTISYPGHNTQQIPAVDLLSDIPIPYHLFFDSKHRLWFQTWGGGFPYTVLYDLNKPFEKPVQFEFITTLKTYYESQDFFETKNGTIWLGGLSIFAFYNDAAKKFELIDNGYLNERSIVYERVNAICEDSERNIWVATNNNGLYRFNPAMQFFQNIPHTNRTTKNKGKGSIMSIAPTKWGTILTGSWGDGLYNYDQGFNLVPANIRGIDNNYGPTVWSICRSRDSNTIWLSSQPGLWKVDQHNRSATFFNPPAFQNKTIRQVVEDQQGDLWLGLQGFGVFKWNAKAGAKNFEAGISRFEAVPVAQINKLSVDHKGLVWVATGGNGAYAIDPGTSKIVYHFGEEEVGAFHLPESGVYTILDYDDSTMLITTATQLFFFNRYLRKTIVIGSTDMISGLIAAAERDHSGYIWLSTTTGLYRISIHNKVFIRFNRDDGIDNDHFILAASCVLPDGRIAFGSSDAVTVFDPSAIRVDVASPPVTITDFKVMNRSLKVDSLMNLKEIRLRSNNNSVAIEFSTLTYNSPYLIKFKLDGLDKEWRVADATNQAIYSYLPSGRYKFQIKTVNENGDSNSSITTLVIHVNPPFWKTWWFYSLLAILTGVIIFGLDRERMKRKEAMQRMRSNIADNLHTQVNTALNNINILSEMARLKADKDPAKSKEYIEQIHTKSQSMIIAMDDMLWSINPQNDNMERTTERMREYIDSLVNKYGVQISFEVDKKVESLELNMKLRHDAFLMFKEGIKNLVTVGARDCHVFISLEKGKLLFTTQFDTEACDLKQLNNLLHRRDLEQKLEALQANIDIDIRKTQSLITLEVPVT